MERHLGMKSIDTVYHSSQAILQQGTSSRIPIAGIPLSVGCFVSPRTDDKGRTHWRHLRVACWCLY